jgi:thioredoxin-dependent peroxiredoxin
MTEQPQVGDKAPDFTLPAAGSKDVSLKSLRGRKVVIFFYPKADTPGCTKESIDFNRLRADFEKAGTTVLGVSGDQLRANEKFRGKYDLDLPLASDTSHAMLNAYGVWGEKSFMGRKYQGITRATFLIGADGRVARIWPKVKVEGHAEEVLEAARAL